MTNTTNYKKEIAELLSKDKFTDKSKLVMNAFLQIGSVPEMALIEKESVIFNRSQEKVKSITTTFILKNGKKMLFEKKNSIQPVSQLQTFNMINLEKSPVTPHLFIKTTGFLKSKVRCTRPK